MSRSLFTTETCFPKSKLALAIAAHIFLSGNALGAPDGGNIVGGSGVIEQGVDVTKVVQESSRLAVDWQSFDIGKNERVEFIQPGQSAVALNRILGNKGTEILGRIDANGHVILVNPRGVVFGESATINVGGLVASGLQINPDDFMNGDLVFKRIEGSDGTVINSGMINAASGGNVVLLGTQVENRGLISANLGSAILASGKEAVLTFDESGLLGVQVNEAILQQELGEGFAVSNSGEIRAENGRVLLSAATTRDVFSQAVNWGEQKQARSVTYNEDGSFTLGAGGDVINRGTITASGETEAGDIVVLGENITNRGAIRADTVSGRAGNIELHSNTTTKLEGEGVVTANAIIGGDIKVLGKNVGLFDHAKIESIGNNGGGQVLFGGAREGLNSQVRNAEFAYIGENTSIDVSATENGNGGKAIIFAEDSARIYGSLAARGGQHGGDGGFVETSGKIGFEIINAPDIGSGGIWLIDPYDIVINELSEQNIIREGNEFVSSGLSARLWVGNLKSALADGTVITIKTGESLAEGQQGNITVSSLIDVAPNKEATLNLIAHNDIIINAGVQASGVHSLHLNLHANKSRNPDSEGSIKFGTSSNESVTIRTNGGDFKIGYINEDGTIDTTQSGAYNVDFSRSIIDVTGPSYDSLGTFDTYFGSHNPPVATADRPYLSDSGRIVVNASNDVNLGGTTGGGVSHNGDVTMIVRGRERDVGDDYAKIYIKAGNNISLDAGRIWSYDNNPTEVLESGQNAHDGFTTLKLDAKNIDLKGNILSAWSEETGDNRQDQNDRLMIDLTAAENISITGSIHTSGGDFTATANNVSFANLNTGSRYGAGNVKVTATGEVDLGDMPMFAEMVSGVDANPLRTPGLEVKADVLNLGSDIYTRGGDILLEASRLNLNARRLETRNSGNIELATASDLDLSDIVSAGDITLKSIGSNDAFVITSTGDFQLDGVLTLDLNQGSANLSNVVNNATDDSANVIITSAANVSYQTSGTIRLGDSVVTGDLTLAGSDITQQAETHLEVAGSSVFSVNNGSIILNHLDNIFTGAIWIEGDGAAEIASSKSLVLGRANETMEFDGTLVLRSGEDIAQASAWSVEGEATLDAAGNITLTEDNALTSLAITRAVEADIHNSQNLNLGDIQNVDTLKLNISGSVTQSEGAEVIVDNLELSLGGSDKITLTNDGNQIQTISGGVGAGHISTNGPLSIGNLIVNGNDDFAISVVGENANVSQASGSILQILSNAAISASEVTLSETIHISNGASLEFNDVKHFVLSATLQGDAGAGEETLTVNGSGEDDLFEVLTSANWDELVAITLKGGEGNDTLVGPNINAQWIFDDSYQLQTESIALTFSSMEKIQGGTQDDRFIFAKGSIPNLTLLGGDGDDVADYSATQDNIRVSLGDIAGLQEIELIRGNNDGTSAYNSALVGGEGEHTWTIKQTNTGEVQTEDGNIIVFEHFNQLVGGEGTDRFILDADLVGANAQIDGGNGDDIFDVNVDFTADILGGNGADRFNLNAATSGFVLGGDGDDIFALTENSRVAVLNGGDGNDELLGFNADLSWYIDAGVVAGATVVKVSDEDTDYVKSATNITTLKGNDGDDTFWFSLNNSGVGVDGGKGTNTADFSKVLADLVVNLGNLQQSGINNVGAIVGNASTTYSSALEDTGSGGAHWQISAENSGTYTLNDDVVTFSGFNQLIGGSGNDTFELAANLTGKNARVAGGDGNNQYIFKSAFSANIAGGADNDDFVLHEDALLTGTLDGGEGSNSLALYDADFVWTIDETAGGQIKVTAAEKSAEDSILVVMEAINLTALKGGAGDDTFQYSLNNSGIAADGGDGFNTADFSRVQGELQVSVSSTDVFGVTNISRIVGNGENATLLGSDNNNSWIWNSTGGVITWGSEKIEFSGFDHWIGGGGKDNFVLHTLNNAPTSIQGGNGEDSLDLGAIESNVEIALGGALNISGLDLSFSGIETVRANENYSNHLISGANQSLWNIDGVNQGSLTVEDNFTIHFENFQNLTGLHGNTFNVTDNGQLVGGSVTGGDQESRLVVTGAADNTWKISGPSLGVLTRGDSTVLSFTQVSVLHGGSGRDQFELTDEAASVSSIDGRGGINTLKANWNSAAPLVWNIDNGKGELVGHIAQFLNISELVGQAGKDQFDIRGNTTLNVIDSGAGDDIINLFDNSRVDSIFAGAGADTIAISGSATVPSIDGGEGDDRLDLANYGTALTWNIANNQIGNFQYINVERVIAPAGGGLINTIQGPDEATKWIITGENAGRFETDKGTFFFQYISQLLGGSADDTFELAGGSITGSIDGGGGNNALHGSSSDAQWSLNGANSGSLSNPEGGVVLFQNIQNLIGGNGTDEFTIGENGLLTGELRGGGGGRDTLISNRAQQAWKLNDEELPSLLSLAGTDIVKFFEVESLVGSGSDQLFGGTLDHNWVINGVNSGNYSIVGQAGSIEFSGIESLTGGAGADHFTVTPNGSIGKFIDGGDGDNSLVVERNGDVVVNLDPTKSIQNAVTALRVQEITANGSGQRRLYGSSQHDDGYIWIIDGENTGTVTPEKTNEQIRFVNFDYLFGGDRSDSFRINTNASVLRIDGGGDTDFVDHSAHEGDLDITIGESLIPGSAFSISNIEGLIGNGGVGSSYKATLRAQGGENTWTIKGVNDGSYSQRNGTSMEFRDFNHLVGGSGNDEFVLREAGLITGSIRDLGGNNTLNLSAINSGRSLKAVVFAGTDAPASRSETLYVQGLQTINGAGSATTLVGPNVRTEWTLNPQGQSTLSYGQNNNTRVTFSNFAHVTGGSAVDIFSINAANPLAGWLSGGGGADQINFAGTQSVSVWLADNTNTVPANGLWHKLLTDIETIEAQQLAQNILRRQSNANQTWSITGSDTGLISGVTFRGFGQLHGSEKDDDFVFSADGRLSGGIDGFGGVNTVDLTNITESVTVALGMPENDNRTNVDLRISRIRSVNANTNESLENRLWAADQKNEWKIRDKNSGDLNLNLTFSGFANLIGGADDDKFSFASTGKITGQIDGGDHIAGDVVDYSSIEDPLVIDLGGTSDLINIENMVGNRATTLYGPDELARWEIEGVNQGELSYSMPTDQKLRFISVNRIVGGNTSDEFIFSAGSVITGGVDGGEGNDAFSITLGRTADTLSTLLSGGAGSDSLKFLGSDSGWRATYGPGSKGDAEFSFIAPETDKPALRVAYDGMDQVQVQSSLDQVVLNGREDADQFRLGKETWQWGSLVAVSYQEGLVRSLVVNGDNADTITISGNITLPESLHLHGGSVVAENGNARVATDKLRLDSVQLVGSTDSPLRISANELAITNNQGSLYLIEENGLTLTDLTGTGKVNLTLTSGNLLQSKEINSDADLEIFARSGAARLNHENNRLGGAVGVEAATDARLRTSGNLRLSRVTASNLDLHAGGNISSAGVINVANLTRLNSGGNITLTQENNLNQVIIEAANNVRLTNNTALSVMGANARDLQLTASQIAFQGKVDASSLIANSVNELSISDVITTNGNVSMTSSAGSFEMLEGGQINSSNGNISITSKENQTLQVLKAATGNIALTSENGQISLLNNVETVALDVKSSSDLYVAGLISTFTDATFTSGDKFEMSEQGKIESSNGNISIFSQGSQTLGALSAKGGEIDLESATSEITINGPVLANTLSANGATKIAIQGAIKATGDTKFISGNEFEMGGQGFIESKGGNIVIATEGVQRLNALSAMSGDVSLTSAAGSISFYGKTEGDTLSVNGVTKVSVFGRIETKGDAVVTSNGGFEMGAPGTISSETGNISITANNVVMDDSAQIESKKGNIAIATEGLQRLGILSAVEGDISLESTANLIQLNGNVAANTLSANGAAALSINGLVNVLGDVSLTSQGGLLMGELSEINSAAGNIEITTEGSQFLGKLTAEQGDVFLRSGGSIADSNGNADNIIANTLFARSVTGIGTSVDWLDLAVGQIDAVNERNGVYLSNKGTLVVERIHNSGDIYLANTQDVKFLKESVNAFHGAEEAQYPPSNKLDKPEYGGHFYIGIETGNILTDGSLLLTEPHIAARTVEIFNPHGAFVPPSPVIYAPDEVRITSGRSRNRPYWGMATPARIIDDTKYYGDVVGAGERLIEVEGLAEFDAAIFTQVKNYFYQDVSIRLPSDQIYEEEE
ncbi:filamentous hemagglutinin N-terminal domain-containing protein [Saccharophagus sp. K07]|uniref:filamentous hemagglutinin N-terminal domain-containing protein n=1 Tax=Saccharophagus sp. K07 TaxID=2283636 RepID=UPI00165294B3|nr:filamentous hemagglutinin N-terminal domain-containing protein [Saccharophagus sp. K07]